MARLPILVAVLATFVGCWHREEVPRITLTEAHGVRHYLPGGEKAGDADYFTSAEGRRLVAKRLRQVFGDLGRSTLKGATRVETFRIIDTRLHPAPRHQIGKLEGLPVVAKGRDQGQEFASKLSDLLLDGRLYFHGVDCWDVDPGVAYRLRDGESSVTVIVCFDCDHLRVVVRDARGRLVHEGGSYFHDPYNRPDVLRELAKGAFPADPAIQKL
jgi:hypothetical protein